jgi:hypothetical protein
MMIIIFIDFGHHNALFMELHISSHGVGVVAAPSMADEKHVKQCYEWHAGNMTV